MADKKNPESANAKIAFAAELLNVEAMLPAAIDWINTNLNPGDVFDREALEEWARAAGYVLPT